MSNFRALAFNPTSKRVEVAEYCDDYYGRHRYGIRFDDGCVHPEAQCGIDAAATQLDSILKERDAMQASAAGWHRIAETIATVLGLPEPESDFAGKVRDKFDALQARVKELEDERNFWKSERDRIKAFLSEGDWQTVKSEQAWRNRALRAEQERDEADERLKPFAKDAAKCDSTCEDNKK